MEGVVEQGEQALEHNWSPNTGLSKSKQLLNVQRHILKTTAGSWGLVRYRSAL